jgi:hypothetical protein
VCGVEWGIAELDMPILLHDGGAAVWCYFRRFCTETPVPPAGLTVHTDDRSLPHPGVDLSRLDGAIHDPGALDIHFGRYWSDPVRSRFAPPQEMN